jgi:lysophospholipase L1-like esterase
MSLRRHLTKHFLAVLCGLLATAAIIAAEEKPVDWEPTIQAFEKQDRLRPPEPGGVLFLGSSSIRLWNTAQAFPGVKSINRGFGGSQIADSVKFAERLVMPYKPRLIVFYAGDNDIAAGKSPAQVASDFQDFAKKIQKELAETRIAFVSIKPSPSRWKQFERQQQANRLVAEFIKSDRRLSYIDVVQPMLGDDGQPRAQLFKKDMLHLNDEGYELWAKIVMPVLQQPD